MTDEASLEVTDAETQKLFAELVQTRQKMGSLRERDKEISSHFKKLADEKLDQGLGKLVILPDTGNGIRFKLEKGGLTKKALVDAGVDKELVDSCVSVSKRMSVF